MTTAATAAVKQALTIETIRAAHAYCDVLASTPDDKAALSEARAAYKQVQARELGLPPGQTWEAGDEPEERRALTAQEKAEKAAGTLQKKSAAFTAKQNPAPPKVCRVCCQTFCAFHRRLYCSEACYAVAMSENKRRRKAGLAA